MKERPMMHKPNNPIRINKSCAITSVKEVTDDVIPYIIVKGYASKMLDASGDFVIDADSENIDTMGIDLKRMNTGNVPLLFSHAQDSAIGKVMTAAYKQDGLEITAKLFQLPGNELSNYTYQATKAGILNSFSVGIIVKEFDMVEKDGQDHLQLAKSELIEVSLVAVPSNNEATFGIIEQKSIDSEASSYKTIISTTDLKQENPDVCGEFETCILESNKGLTYDETKKEDWVKSQDFRKYMSVLLETIEDNWYENKWDEITPEEALQNIKMTFDSFLEDLNPLLNGEEPDAEGNDVVEALNHDGSFAFADNAKSINGEDMHTKNTTEETPDPVTTEPEVTETPEVPETPQEEAAAAPAEPVAQSEEVKEPEEKPEEVKEPEAVVETPEVDAIDTLVASNAIMGANLSEMSLEDLEKVYNSIGALSDSIADYVKTNVQEELEAQEAS